MSEVRHGNTGYRRGCRCEVCRADHTVVNARWRKARAAAQDTEPSAPAPAPAVREPLAIAPTLDLDAEPGAIEKALEEDLAAPAGEVLWLHTLQQMARLNARVLDQVTLHGRLDLVSPVQLRTLEILNRLAYMKVNGLTAADSPSEMSDAERAQKLLLEALGDDGGQP